MKNLYGIVCALFIGLAQAQQPPVALALEAPSEFHFHTPVPALQVIAAAQAAKELRQAREAVAQASPKKWPRVHAQLKGILKAAEKKLASTDKTTLHLIDFMGRYKTPEERIEAALHANDRELLRFALARKEPVNEQAFYDVAAEAVRYHRKPADADYKLSLVEELLIRAHNISQDIRDKLLGEVCEIYQSKPDLIPLLLYGGIITIGQNEYPVEGGARGQFVEGGALVHFFDKWPAGSLHKIIATGNVEGKSAADLYYLQHKKLKLESGARSEWWKEIEADTLQAVQKALNEGADVNQLDSIGRSLLHIAVQYSTPAIVKQLFNRHAKIDIKDSYEKTPLHFAAAAGQTEMIPLLLDSGAKIDDTDSWGSTPLHWATGWGQTEAAGVLLERGASIDATDIDGLTPLHSAALAGNTKAVCLLLDQGAQIDAKGERGETPLYEATIRGQTEVICVLLNRGANPCIRDDRGKKALDYGKNDEIRVLLKDAMKKYTEKAGV